MLRMCVQGQEEGAVSEVQAKVAEAAEAALENESFTVKVSADVEAALPSPALAPAPYLAALYSGPSRVYGNHLAHTFIVITLIHGLAFSFMLRQTTKLLLSAVALQSSYLVWGALQERVSGM